MLYIDEHIFDFDLTAALDSISGQRRSQALRYRFEQGQRECVLAYLLLKRALKEEYGIDSNPLFGYGPHGKPFLIDHPGIHFSLSHCREAVACAVSSAPVGVDVESVKEYRESLINYTMNSREAEQIATAERPDIEFTRLWTMKEAVAKLSGTGITNDIKDLLTLNPNIVFSTTVDTHQRYVCTMCRKDVVNR